MPNGFHNINGTGQNNTINGTDLDEIIHGRGGNDIINGGSGLDYLYGDGGADTFVIEAVDGVHKAAVIFDFDRTEGDTIHIDAGGTVAFPAGALFDGETFSANGWTITVIADDQDSDGQLDTYITADNGGLNTVIVILGYSPDQLTDADFA